MMMLRPLAALLLAAMAGSGQAPPRARAVPSEMLVVRDAWVRQTSATRTVTSGYMIIENRAASPITLRRVAVDGVGRAELHTVVDQNGQASMRPLATLVIPARGSVTLAPGTTHLMLTDVTRPLRVGTTVRMTFTFDGNQTRTVDARVRPLDADGAR
jgi:copper(I)-binding protein